MKGPRVGLRASRSLQVGGLAIALAILLWTARSSWIELSRDTLSINTAVIATSLAALCLGHVVFVGLWRRLLDILGAPLRYPATLQLWAVANLGRYVPGKIWGIAGVAAEAHRAGLNAGLGATASVIALGLSIGSGALVSVALIPDVVMRLGPAAFLTMALAGAVLLPIVIPGLMSRALGLLPASFGCARLGCVGRVPMAQLLLMFCVGWGVHGLAFCIFVSAFGPVAWHDAARLTGSYTLSYVAGLLAVFAPGGIGVREGVLSKLLLLSGFEHLPVHTLSVATRVWAIASEILILGVALAVRARARRSS